MKIYTLTFRLFIWLGSMLLLKPSTLCAQWVQVGNSHNETGSVAMSSDGNRIAIGNPFFSLGLVRVYQWNNSTWNQLGTDMLGVSNDYEFATKVSLSADGATIAIGTPRRMSFLQIFGSSPVGPGSTISNEAGGQVNIYRWNGSRWTQLGVAIEDDSDNYDFGKVVAIAANGNRVVVGSPSNGKGQVFVYEWNGSAWSQLGAAINSTANGDSFGEFIAMSSDGRKVAISAYRSDEAYANAGQVKVFQWNGSTWTPVGAAINGNVEFDLFGLSMSLSPDGNRIAATASPLDENTAVRVFQWNGNAWSQLGADLTGEGFSDNFGRAIALSNTGNRIAIGALANDTGQVRVYEWNNTTWAQVDGPIDGSLPSERFGNAVSLSSDGNRLVASGGNDNGNVRVYATNASLPVAWMSFRGEICKKEVILKWQTVHERDTKLFEIQRSSDAQQFKRLGFIEATGTLQQQSNYEYNDSNPLPGTNYYRLRQVNTNGKETYSRTITVNVEGDGAFLLYPVPAGDNLHIKHLQHIEKLCIVDFSGRVVSQCVGDVSTIDISALSAGVYVVELQTTDGDWLRKRFVKW